MDRRYLTFPELPPGHHYSLDRIFDAAGERYDIDIFFSGEGKDYDIDIFFSGEGKDYDRGKIHEQLVAWVVIGLAMGTFVRERSLVTRKHTYELQVADPQEGIDLLVARLWMGMTGET